MAKKPIFATLGLLFSAGACLLLFLIVLGGSRDSKPLNQLFFIEADTSGIPNAPDTARWTLYGVCSKGADGHNSDCTPTKADFPFDPVRNFNTQSNIPQDFIDNSSTYYFLTRFAFPFYLIALFFSVVSMLFNVFACFSRLGAALVALFNFVGLLFAAAAASLITANYVMARNTFNDAGRTATLGVKIFGLTWAVVALLLICMVLNCGICAAGRSTGRRRGSAEAGGFNRESSFEKTSPSRTGSRRGFFSASRASQREPAYDAEEPGLRSSYERGAPHNHDDL